LSSLRLSSIASSITPELVTMPATVGHRALALASRRWVENVIEALQSE